MKFNSEDLKARPGQRILLKDWPTRIPRLYETKDDFRDKLAESAEKISHCQERHYSSRSNALLLIFQGMDAAGKDSAIKHVMSGINPQGCLVHAFKEPSHIERAHDFLWRAAVHLPERGHIGIFNRSYYEDVLVVRVHPELLLTSEARRPGPKAKVWAERFQSIRDFEAHLYREGTHIVKFFLHVSKEEQRQRFLARIDDPDKNWKLAPSDIKERKFWNHYQRAYADAISQTTATHAPWYIIPADDKENARLMISRILLEKFRKLKLTHPMTSPARAAELKRLRRQLANPSVAGQ